MFEDCANCFRLYNQHAGVNKRTENKPGIPRATNNCRENSLQNEQPPTTQPGKILNLQDPTAIHRRRYKTMIIP